MKVRKDLEDLKQNEHNKGSSTQRKQIENREKIKKRVDINKPANNEMEEKSKKKKRTNINQTTKSNQEKKSYL